MTSTTDILQNAIFNALQLVQPESNEKLFVELERPADPTHGDFASTIALSFFSQLKKSGQEMRWSTPRSLADEIVTALRQSTSKDNKLSAMVEEWSVAGPGFINIKLKLSYLVDQVASVATPAGRAKSLIDASWAGKKVMIEFTDPNPFKELHIGHAYSNSVGEAISRLLKAVGADVYQACYQGDVGMHVAKSIWGLLHVVLPSLPEYQAASATKNKLEAVVATLDLLELTKSPLKVEVPVDTLAELLGKAYAAGATAYKDVESTQEEIKKINFLTFLSAQDRLVSEDGWQRQVDYSQFVDQNDELYPIVKVIFQTARRWSMEYFEIMYGKLGMQKKASGKYFDYYFAESVVGEYGLQTVYTFLEKGVFKKSNGAVIFPGSEYGLHDRVFVNSLGLPTYEAKELGLAPEKYKHVEYDRSIIITGNEIDEYFKVLLKALSQTRPDLAAKTTHLSHGMVRLPEGKMSSRTGNVITTLEVLDSAAAKIQQTLAENKTKMSAPEREYVATQVGLAAVKYAFLKHSIGNDIAFSFEESLSFTGQSGPYLQYTHVRCHSILAKAEGISSKLTDKLTNDLDASLISTIEEQQLVRILAQFSEHVVEAANEFAPHVLAHYLFALAQAFSVFYTNCQILKEKDSNKKQLRLTLVTITASVLEAGLTLLGISTVPQM